jgi:hypothetical protein
MSHVGIGGETRVIQKPEKEEIDKMQELLDERN